MSQTSRKIRWAANLNHNRSTLDTTATAATTAQWFTWWSTYTESQANLEVLRWSPEWV